MIFGARRSPCEYGEGKKEDIAMYIDSGLGKYCLVDRIYYRLS